MKCIESPSAYLLTSSRRLDATSAFYRSLVFLLVVLLFSPCIGVAQKSGGSFSGFGFPTVNAGPKVSYSAEYDLERGGKKGRLRVTAKIGDGFHTYSTTQAAGGPFPTSISTKNTEIKLTGPFIPDHEATPARDEAWPDLVVEEHHGTVVWTAPFEADKPLDEAKFQPEIEIDALVCGNGTCEPVGDTIIAKFAEFYGGQELMYSFRADSSHAVWSAKLSESAATPATELLLTLRADVDPGYHVYRYVPGDSETNFRTMISVKTKSGLKFKEPTTSAPIVTNNLLGEPIEYYAGSVEWQIPVEIPADAPVGEYPIELNVGFYTCDENSCDPPAAVALNGSVMVAEKANPESKPLSLSALPFVAVVDSDHLADWIDTPGTSAPVPEVKQATLPVAPAQPLTLMHLLAALAGGFILNFMPCVLPVIGLKVMSFVEQAGSDRRKIVALNLAFVAGILAVMLALSLATVAAKLVWGTAFGWGQQFTILEFKVALAMLVFAMSLSFLGVWEIPIPGFAMSVKSGQLMEQEGILGAFSKGILTTVLATPCSGPLLGSLFGLSLSLSEMNVIFLYFIVGIGMSLPYLVLCVHPGFVDFLPRPGAWMETLKQALAFPLLLTVVFFVASIGAEHRIATLILLIFVWFACWLVGRVPGYAKSSRKRIAWTSALASIALGGFIGFGYFGPVEHKLPWIEYNELQLTKLRQQGKTVMVDFTANWCVNCQVNLRMAIDRVKVADIVAANDVVPMVADWTDRSDEILEKLAELQSASIPVLAIYPAEPGAEPIILRDLLTESQVIDALKRAGPSLPEATLTSKMQ
ncbi:MAG: thioredoxin family protein [Planctomycetales bacterium]|nr:thioredoxin family protein [Planctomycetales bacterium]